MGIAKSNSWTLHLWSASLAVTAVGVLACILACGGAQPEPAAKAMNVEELRGLSEEAGAAIGSDCGAPACQYDSQCPQGMICQQDRCLVLR